MPSSDRDGSRDRELVIKHQHSWSDSGRSSVPMWDSSDPDRAPPPLPLNPHNSNIPHTKPNTSATVAAAAQALADKARESFGPSSYTINPRPGSPEKSPTRSPQHKRLQSLQTGGTKDFKNYFENGRSPSPERNSSRSVTPASAKEWPSSSPERSVTPTPVTPSKDLVKNGRGIRRSMSRPELRPILRENTPPSSTVLAMQNMATRSIDLPLANITNSSMPRTPQPMDGLYGQIANLTSIATKLQVEMTQLSRRSKDNATDLIALKNATSSRDEDIKKSLRELVSGVRASESGLLGPPRIETPRASSSLEFNKSRDSPTLQKTVSLPRIFPYNGNVEENLSGNDLPHGINGTASVSMLEKIVREMATKEGQDRLMQTLPALIDKSGKDSSETKKKVEELIALVREKQSSQALVRHNNSSSRNIGDSPPTIDLDFDRPSPLAMPRSSRDMGSPSPRPVNQESRDIPASAIVNGELLKLLQKVKDSVAYSGGITGEVKSLVRDLRGEVLGMGRELGRKVDSHVNALPNTALVKQGNSQDDLARIVQEGMSDLREQMNQVILSKRRQSSSSSSSRNTVDSQEVFQVVKHALAERGLDRTQPLSHQAVSIDRDAIFAAVKEAYEEYKPEIEVQQFGLDRDEILECLREGLEDYRSSKETRETTGFGKEEIISAMREAMQHFQPPRPVTEASEIKEEVLSAVRECLDEFKPAQSAGNVSREHIMDAVKESMAAHKKEGAREIDINKEDLFDAVQAGLNNSKTPFGGYGDKVLHSLHEIVEGMQVEFRQYSAANGRDTEQVLDAVKDGLETLRSQVQSYVDRSQDVTSKEEIIDTIKAEMDNLRSNFERFAAQMPSQQSTRSVDSQHRDDILMAISAGFVSLKAALGIHHKDGEVPDEAAAAMKEEFEQLRSLILSGSANHKDEIIETVQESLKSLHAQVQSRDLDNTSNEDILASMKAELNSLRETLSAPSTRSNDEGIIETVRESLDAIRAQLAADQSESASDALGAIKEEFEQLREHMNGSLAKENSPVDKEELLETIRNGLENAQFSIDRGISSSVGSPDALEGIRSEIEQLRLSLAETNGDRGVGSNLGSADAFETVRGELEHLRQSLAATLIKSGAKMDTEEVVDTVRLGLDDLRSHIEKKLDNPERFTSATGEMLDALNEGLDSLRLDIAKAIDKPPAVDMTVSYEILDTLRDGLNGVREDISRLKSDSTTLKNGEVILADNAMPSNKTVSDVEDLAAALKKNDLDKLEVMLAHLQIKVEAMDQNIQSVPNATQASTDALRKEDLANIVVMLTDIQGTVADLSNKEKISDQFASLASKEDTDAIETLLQNTKAKIDEQILPGLKASITKDDLDAVETVVRMTNESIDELSSRVDGKAASKDDILSLEVLVQDATSAIEDLRTKFAAADDSDEKVTKSDVDAVESICSDIKAKIEILPEIEDLPSKSDVEQLTGLLEELRHSHSKFRDRYENDIGVTARAFDDRKEDTKTIVDQIAELKLVMESSKDELKSRLKRGTQDVRALDEILQGIEDKIDEAPNAIEHVQNLKEIVQEEFDRANSSIESLKTGHDQRSAEILSKQDELRTVIISDLVDKLDDRVTALMIRHDEHQQATEHAANLMAQRAGQQDEVLASSRAVTDDLKLTIDTLGASVTAIAPTLQEATDRMSDDAKTVYTMVDKMHTKMDDNHADGKIEHELTRHEIAKFLSGISNLQEEVHGFHPQFMQTLKDVLAVVGEHYDHSKHFQESSRVQAEDIKNSFTSISSTRDLGAPMLPPPPPMIDDTKIHSKLDDVLGQLDHSTIHCKLDELLNHSNMATKSAPDYERIDDLQEQITSIATEVSAFVAFQTKIITADHENKEREANQAAIDLSRCITEKEELESSVNHLIESKTNLAAEVEALKAERDGLAAQKLRLTADVASLETALHIRTEELHAMDTRADALERRIIEGVMDHSRTLLLAKAQKGVPNMNLKRVTSNSSNASINTTVPSSAVSSGIGMALKSRTAASRPSNTANPTARRILSLGQISGNRQSGIQPVSTPPTGGLNNLKRSHTVKPRGVQKGSWPARRTVSDFDKENDAVGEESDQDENEKDGTKGNEIAALASAEPYDNGSVFEAMTPAIDRRASYGTGPSDYSYGTGSYITGTDLSRRSSYASTVKSNVGARTSFNDPEQENDNAETEEKAEPSDDVAALHAQIDEQLMIDEGPFHEGLEEHKHEEQPTHEEEVKHQMILYERDRHHESDSGLGTDLPTAPLSHTLGSDLFKVAEEHF